MASNPSISDHALLRFLERAYHLGPIIDAARDEIAKGAVPAIDFDAPVVIVHGVRLLIRDGVVVTAIPKAESLRDKTRPHRREGE